MRLLQPPYFLLKMNDILVTFGTVIAVLIAIEIFINVILYRPGRCHSRQAGFSHGLDGHCQKSHCF